MGGRHSRTLRVEIATMPNQSKRAVLHGGIFGSARIVLIRDTDP
jgi:hypothetical protein